MDKIIIQSSKLFAKVIEDLSNSLQAKFTTSEVADLIGVKKREIYTRYFDR